MAIDKNKVRKYWTLDKRSLEQLRQMQKIYDLQPSKIVEIALDKLYHEIKLYDTKYKIGDKPYKKDQKELFKEIYGMDPVDDKPFVKY